MTTNIFVFGSNREGRHGKGAALTARKNYGAIYGQPEGIQGQSYAIITKELRPWINSVQIDEIKQGVDKFILFANNHREYNFLITRIGCGLAGFNWETQIKPLFKLMPNNCKFI